MNKSNKLKVFVTCPLDYVEKVRLAIWNAWGGKMWNYSHCSFITMVWKWYFCPLEWATPAIWKVWKHQVVDEAKIEFICDKDVIKSVIRVIKDTHPYEEVWYNVLELLDI